jgi:sterol desaturase/sphingolipid hydroxylase (fatty acid hydroxylase superfamily)
VWDKIFGTFTPYSSREPDYGVTAGIRSWRRTIEY